MKILVLGAGAVGVATAWYLAKAGHEVTVIERQPAAAMETSWGNGCVIHASEAEPWSQPGMPRKILSWLGKEDAPLLLRYSAVPKMWRWGLEFAANCTPTRFKAHALANLELALLSLKSVQEIAHENNLKHDSSSRGVIKIFRDRDSLNAAQRRCEEFVAHGLKFERVDVAAALALEPALRDTAHTLVGALYFERDEVRDCNGFTQGLAAQCAGQRVKFMYDTEAHSLTRLGARASGVMTSKGSVDADAVVVALASFSAPFLKSTGLRIPIYPVKGISITFPRKGWADAPSMPVIDDSKLFGLVPVGDRMRISGSAEIADFSSTPAPERAEAIIANTTFTFPTLDRQYEPKTAIIWGGLRPVTPSGNPLIGKTSIDGLWINAGHGHLGWTLACGSGRILADMIDGRDCGLHVSTVRAFSPGGIAS